MMAKLATRIRNKFQRLRNSYWPGSRMEENCYLLLYHRANLLDAKPAKTDKVADGRIHDSELVRRIVAVYQRACKADLGQSMWKTFFSAYHEPIHQSILYGDKEAVTDLFRNPEASDLFYGFDILTKSYQGAFKSEKVRKAYAKLCLDGLVRFAESIGAIPLDNPETWQANIGVAHETEKILASLANAGVKFSVPNPFPNEHGLGSSSGVISYRDPQALYQAWRIKQLVAEIENPRVLEIGAGLGRTAFYAYKLGIKDYTIVDIPVTATAQAYFLGRSLGEGSIVLDGEFADSEPEKVKIISPQSFLEECGAYDLIINVDSLTEMDIHVAKAYWEKIKGLTETFLSINHEANDFRVCDLISEDLDRLDVQRGLYWMRRGYAEELIRTRTA